jgi:predicted DNA-binding ribbon-helix-helix protein
MASAFPSPLLSLTEESQPDRHSALVMRNISVRGHRTSIRLEPQMWDSMTEICRREFCTPLDVCSYVAERKDSVRPVCVGGRVPVKHPNGQKQISVGLRLRRTACEDNALRRHQANEYSIPGFGADSC